MKMRHHIGVWLAFSLCGCTSLTPTAPPAPPFGHDPKVVEAIVPGQTIPEIRHLLNHQGWRPCPVRSREQIIMDIRGVFPRVAELSKNPKAEQELLARVPDAQQYTYIQFQGYPTTREWIFVFFASTDGTEDGMRVVYRVVVPWGCF
jgi:hypothetical protein